MPSIYARPGFLSSCPDRSWISHDHFKEPLFSKSGLPPLLTQQLMFADKDLHHLGVEIASPNHYREKLHS
jgi:hypothetical protein